MITPLKEQYFLQYNKDNIAKDLVASEYHFRKLKKYQTDNEGHANCIVKHLLHAEGESEEATSHGLVVEGSEVSHNFKLLSDKIRKFRKTLQTKNISRDDGIREIRELRSEFESFNPEFDVSKCESCGSIEDVLKQAETLQVNPPKEKVLNTSPQNSKSIGENMKNAAIIYGANFAGKLVDEVILPMAPAEYDIDMPATVGLAVGLPILAKFLRLGDAVDQTLVVLGGYMSTKIWDYIEAAIAPPAVRAIVSQFPQQAQVPARITPTPTALSKYVVT